MDFDTSVKLNIYETIANTAHVPTDAEVSKDLQVPLADVLIAFDRLHKKRLLVPEPGDPSRIRMAPPFSGVPTSFGVRVGEKLYYANCAWDALGVAAALHHDALIEASDGFSCEPIQIEIKDGQPVQQACVIHFAVPAAKWWADIVYT